MSDEISTGNLGAIVYHLRKGEDNGGIEREALALFLESVKERMERLKDELKITDQLLETSNELLEAIPECELHGNQCVPHALEWIKERVDDE